MDAEEVKRRLARTTPRFIKPGDPDDVLSPLPLYRSVPSTPEERETMRSLCDAVYRDLAKEGL
jgi:hypothetical protein